MKETEMGRICKHLGNKSWV